MYGVSKNKFIKGTTIPKRAGNFSKIRMHYMQRSYPITLHNGEIIIGKNTPGYNLLSRPLIELMRFDKFFQWYRQEGVYVHNGKEYKCWRTIERSYLKSTFFQFVFTISIDTLGDFTFDFPNL